MASHRTRTIDGPEDDILSLAEVAKYLRTSPKTVRRLMEEGLFPRPMKYHRGGHWWSWLDVVAYLHLQDRLRAGDLGEIGPDTPPDSQPPGKISEGQGVDTEGQGVDRAGQTRRPR